MTPTRRQKKTWRRRLSRARWTAQRLGRDGDGMGTRMAVGQAIWCDSLGGGKRWIVAPWRR